MISSQNCLRLTGDGGRMLKGWIAVTAVQPTSPVVGDDNAPPTAPENLRATAVSEHDRDAGMEHIHRRRRREGAFDSAGSRGHRHLDRDRHGQHHHPHGDWTDRLDGLHV